jgi:hypothetical protein
MASVADILPPEEKRRYSQTSPQRQKAFQDQEKSRVSNSRIRESSSPASNRPSGQGGGGQSPSRYRQLRDNLRTLRGTREDTKGMSSQGGRTYGQNRRSIAMPKTESKLSSITVIMMLSVAVCLDILELLLDFIVIGVVINPILDILAFLGFYIWLKIKGIDLIGTKSGAKKAIAFFGTEMVDLIFAGGDLPLWTLDIGLVIFIQKGEIG